MNPDLDPTDGLPTRAALARDLLRYKMEDYSENGFCASWLVDLEYELWEAAARDSPSEDEKFMVNTSRECRLLAELCGGWWAWDKAAPPGENPVFMPMERWLQALADRGKRESSSRKPFIPTTLTPRIRTVTVQHSHEKHHPQDRRRNLS